MCIRDSFCGLPWVRSSLRSAQVSLRFLRVRWLLVVLSLAVAALLLLSSGIVPQWGRWYCPDAPHRLQTEAFLRGDLALSHSPAALDFDLAWTRGGVQQVWGLGV